jgi:hypothetical protein
VSGEEGGRVRDVEEGGVLGPSVQYAHVRLNGLMKLFTR